MDKSNLAEEEKNSLILLAQSVRFLMHEIKNPLTAISFQCEMLRDDLIESGCQNISSLLQNIAEIERESERIKTLSNAVNDFFIDVVGRDNRVELVSFVNNLIATFRNKIKTDFKLKEAFVVFDREKLRSVLENLIKNAIESTMGKNGEKEEFLETEGSSAVEILLFQENDNYVIEIRDRGTGLPPGASDHLFEPFYTTKMQGSGIGLFLAKRFVEGRGGSIVLLPRDGGGALCRVSLPALSAE